jgi:hypothetical protein
MTTIEMKNQVIGKINQLNDNELLIDVYKLLVDNLEDLNVYKLSNNHKIAIDRAISQIDNGDFLTNDRANNEINAWLNK